MQFQGFDWLSGAQEKASIKIIIFWLLLQSEIS